MGFSLNSEKESPWLKVRSLSIKINIWSAFALHCVYDNIDVDAGNRYRIHSLRLRFVTIASIKFEIANIDIDAKCGWTFRKHSAKELEGVPPKTLTEVLRRYTYFTWDETNERVKRCKEN